VKIPGDALPGLRTEDDGFVHGDEFELVRHDTVRALADWARTFTGRLPNDEVADVDLRTGITIEDWCAALDDIASRYPKS
jgi:hypothetical protein